MVASWWSYRWLKCYAGLPLKVATIMVTQMQQWVSCVSQNIAQYTRPCHKNSAMLYYYVNILRLWLFLILWMHLSLCLISPKWKPDSKSSAFVWARFSETGSGETNKPAPWRRILWIQDGGWWWANVTTKLRQFVLQVHKKIHNLKIKSH